MSLKRKLATILFIVFTLFTISAPSALAFDLFGKPCEQVKDSSVCQDPQRNGAQNPTLNIINTAANIIALATGIAAVIIIIISGITLAGSAGNQQTVTNSRRRIAFALVGMVVVALAWTITRFITDRVIQ